VSACPGAAMSNAVETVSSRPASPWCFFMFRDPPGVDARRSAPATAGGAQD
jgi:hypothetical protein